MMEPDAKTSTLTEELPPSAPNPAPTAPVPWVSIGLVTIAFIAAFYPMILRLVDQWSTDDDMGHGFFVPAVALWIAWQKKDELLGEEYVRNYWGLALMLYGSLQYLMGTLAAELFLTRTAIVVSIGGAILWAGGMRLLKKLGFPVFMLFFMVPLPTVIYNQITFPLQLLASSVAEKALLLIGIPVLRDGNILELVEHRLSVVEACSGIRSLLSLTFLSLIYGYFFETKTLNRAILLASTVPIAIAANSFRVTVTGVLYQYKPEWAEGFFHSAEGWVIFMFALAMLLGFHRFLIWFETGVKNARAQAQQATAE